MNRDVLSYADYFMINEIDEPCTKQGVKHSLQVLEDWMWTHGKMMLGKTYMEPIKQTDDWSVVVPVEKGKDVSFLGNRVIIDRRLEGNEWFAVCNRCGVFPSSIGKWDAIFNRVKDFSVTHNCWGITRKTICNALDSIEFLGRPPDELWFDDPWELRIQYINNDIFQKGRHSPLILQQTGLDANLSENEWYVLYEDHLAFNTKKGRKDG